MDKDVRDKDVRGQANSPMSLTPEGGRRLTKALMPLLIVEMCLIGGGVLAYFMSGRMLWLYVVVGVAMVMGVLIAMTIMRVVREERESAQAEHGRTVH